METPLTLACPSCGAYDEVEDFAEMLPEPQRTPPSIRETYTCTACGQPWEAWYTLARVVKGEETPCDGETPAR